MDRKEFLRLLDSGNDFVAKKGTVLYRSTTVEKEQIIGKKYVSARKDDVLIYNDMVSNLAKGSKVFNTEYATNKKISVAGTKTQAETLQNIYGTNAKSGVTKPIKDMTGKEISNYLYSNPFGHDLDILNKPVSNPDTKKYMDALIEKGYDAVVDMVDYSLGYSDGPIIILKSEDSLKRKKT